jgi:hypothetical protein
LIALEEVMWLERKGPDHRFGQGSCTLGR